MKSQIMNEVQNLMGGVGSSAALAMAALVHLVQDASFSREMCKEYVSGNGVKNVLISPLFTSMHTCIPAYPRGNGCCGVRLEE